MTEKVIRPIPKYILRMIERADKKDFKQPDKQLRFYAYLTLCQKELVKVTVAVKHYRKKRYMKAVALHGLHSEKCFVKDIEYNRLCGMTYRVGWYDEGIQKHSCGQTSGVSVQRLSAVSRRQIIQVSAALRKVPAA